MEELEELRWIVSAPNAVTVLPHPADEDGYIRDARANEINAELFTAEKRFDGHLHREVAHSEDELVAQCLAREAHAFSRKA
jgi:hypothetical protein